MKKTLKRVISHTQAFQKDLNYGDKFNIDTFIDLTKIYNQIITDYEIPKKESKLNEINLDNSINWCNVNQPYHIYTDLKKIEMNSLIPSLIKEGLETDILHIDSEFENFEKIIHLLISNKDSLRNTDVWVVFKMYINFIYGYINSRSSSNINLQEYTKSILSYIIGSVNYIYLDLDTIYTKELESDPYGILNTSFKSNILDRISSIGLTYDITDIEYFAIERAKKYFYIDSNNNVISRGVKR